MPQFSVSAVLCMTTVACAGAKAFALDTRSKRQWRNPPLTNANAAAFRLACNQFGFSPRQILPHGQPLTQQDDNPGQLQLLLKAT